ncbi:uncharacterized protein LOC116143886 [Pistacia vera]|uniref:uncharacterized protein LOC116143886 n=1 Tax=Pistacia vera TaxID=55513 RepID=UPI0012631132|nr:uncharacterized protein LOC116143886 [Pistacia vera]
MESSSRQTYVEINLSSLPTDPRLRIKILEYHPNDRDKVRRAYLQKGPCQPHNHNFKKRAIGNLMHRFNPIWFREYANWLEYSVEKEVVFCLCCYLFRHEIGKQAGGDSFISEGFDAWNKKARLDIHVGGPNSAHNQAWKNCEALMRQDQHIEMALNRYSNQMRKDYRLRLSASVDCLRFLLKQGLDFHGDNEYDGLKNHGNFLELLNFLAMYDEEIDAVVGQNAPSNVKLTSPDIQHDIINAFAIETVNAIIHDLGNDFFAILVDESRNISVKKQMIVVLRYVDKKGYVVERFLGIIHVNDTSASSLKLSIDSLFSKHGLSISRLQLTLVAIAKNDAQVGSLFNMEADLVNVVGASCKRRDILRERQAAHVSKALSIGKLTSGRGLNQETTLKRAGDTRGVSHYGMLHL